MDLQPLESWPTTPAEAIALQRLLSPQVLTCDRLEPITTVAGVDAGFEENGSITRAAVVVLSFPELTVLETAIARLPTMFPYVPGLLSFREIPALLNALGQLQQIPNLILCDGQGIAHPRRFGIASHLGVLMDRPTIGVAKSRYIGSFEEPGIAKGSWSPLWDREEVIGAVLRSRQGTKPLFVSPGHRISLETAIAYVLACTPKYRLPETTRLADRLASRRGTIPAASGDRRS